jgi:hypothetical protein
MKNIFSNNFNVFFNVHIFLNWGKKLPIDFKKLQIEALS